MHDLRRFAGKAVIVGQLGSTYEARGLDLQSGYILGVLEDGEDLPAPVKAIIEDDAQEASEALWVVRVDDEGRCEQVAPLVVLDDQGQLRYGLEFLAAVQSTGITTQACLVRGVRFEERHSW